MPQLQTAATKEHQTGEQLKISPTEQGWAAERAVVGICGPPNGSDVKLRGQGPRGYGRAARRLPAFEARDAGSVTPRKYRRTSRLGRRAEAGPRQLLRRVSPPASVTRAAHRAL
jgi:hypothetical protein